MWKIDVIEQVANRLLQHNVAEAKNSDRIDAGKSWPKSADQIIFSSYFYIILAVKIFNRYYPQ